VVPAQLAFDARALTARGFQVTVIDMQAATDADRLRGLVGSVPGPAVIFLPQWGADSRYRGGESASLLNEASRQWPVEKTFGTNPVLVNYSYPNPWGDPAFGIAILDRRPAAPRSTP
jgi:hypothetical protein